MARPSKLASMSIEALLQLRDDIGSVLSRKAGQLQTQLAALGDGGWISSAKRAVGRPRGSKMKGGKVAPNCHSACTGRLDYVIHHLGLALGGRPAASFTRRLMLPVSNDTLLRVIRRRDSPSFAPPTVVG